MQNDQATNRLLALTVFSSLRGWSLKDLGGDVAAGLTVAAIAIPEQMATAGLGGFAPAAGLFAFIAGAIAFAVFGASRSLSVGADSTITPIFAGGLASLAVAGSPAYASFAATLAVMVGSILVVGGLFRTGWIANLLSVPVVTGFLAGIAVHIVVSQLPAVFGVAPVSGTLPEQIAKLTTHLSQANPYSVVLGMGVFATIYVFEKISDRIPSALIGLSLATLATVYFHLESKGVLVLGAIDQSWPQFGLPIVGISAIGRLVALALLISLVVMVQTAATSRSFLTPSGPTPNINLDFVGVGAGSLLSGMFSGFAVNASPPRTAVANASGGRSQFASLLAAALVGLLIVFGPKLLTHVPHAGLAGVLLFVAQRITRFSVMGEVYRKAIGEFLLIIATIVAIVLLPIQVGVTVGVVLSLLHGVWATTRTRLIEFERLPGTTIWWPPGASKKGEIVDGVLVLAFQAPISFLNANTFRREFIGAIGHCSRPLSSVVLEASNIVEIDFTASQVLIEVIRYCRDAKISFEIARLESVHGQRDLERFGIVELLGQERIFHSVQSAIDDLKQMSLAGGGDTDRELK